MDEWTDEMAVRGMGVLPGSGAPMKRNTRAGRPCHAVGLVLGVMLLMGCAARDSSRPVSRMEDVIKRFEIDQRLTLCNIQQRPDGTLVGEVEMPQHREVFAANGFDVSRVRLLPEESGTRHQFGIVTVDHAILHKAPADEKGDRDNVTDVLRGEWVWILDRHDDGWTFVHSSDGYLGWLDGAALVSVDLNVFPEQAATQPSIEVAATGVQAGDGADKAESIQRRVLRDAQQFIGAPYVWGGKTVEGIDCSGLTQTSFARSGILLPRDADQQANVGRLVATRYFREALLPGDLLFFVSPKRGNVHHVAIYMGDGRYIEAAGKDVHISSLTPGAQGYDAKRMATFGWARRVID